MEKFNIQLFGDDSPTYSTVVTYSTATPVQMVTYSTVVTLVGEPAQFGILDKFYLDSLREALPQDSLTGAISLKQATNQKYQITGAINGFFEVGGDSASDVTIHAVVGDALDDYINDKLSPLDEKLDVSDFEEYQNQVTNDLDEKLNASDFEEYQNQMSNDLDEKLGVSDFEDFKTSNDNDITQLKGSVRNIFYTQDGSIVFADHNNVGIFTLAGSTSYSIQSSDGN